MGRRGLVDYLVDQEAALTRHGVLETVNPRHLIPHIDVCREKKTARCGINDSGEAVGFAYSNTFACIPFDIPFRPARTTPRPFIRGTQTAVVVGTEGEEIEPDKYGRVKVQFHWDRAGQFNLDSSCGVRVPTLWAGKNWGMLHIRGSARR